MMPILQEGWIAVLYALVSNTPVSTAPYFVYESRQVCETDTEQLAAMNLWKVECKPGTVLAQVPEEKPTVPENLKQWPPGCQRLHDENRKCDLGYRSCNQHRIEYWRRRCERAEPHAQ